MNSLEALVLGASKESIAFLRGLEKSLDQTLMGHTYRLEQDEQRLMAGLEPLRFSWQKPESSGSLPRSAKKGPKPAGEGGGGARGKSKGKVQAQKKMRAMIPRSTGLARAPFDADESHIGLSRPSSVGSGMSLDMSRAPPLAPAPAPVPRVVDLSAGRARPACGRTRASRRTPPSSSSPSSSSVPAQHQQLRQTKKEKAEERRARDAVFARLTSTSSRRDEKYEEYMSFLKNKESREDKLKGLGRSMGIKSKTGDVYVWLADGRRVTEAEAERRGREEEEEKLRAEDAARRTKPRINMSFAEARSWRVIAATDEAEDKKRRQEEENEFARAGWRPSKLPASTMRPHSSHSRDALLLPADAKLRWSELNDMEIGDVVVTCEYCCECEHHSEYTLHDAGKYLRVAASVCKSLGELCADYPIRYACVLKPITMWSGERAKVPVRNLLCRGAPARNKTRRGPIPVLPTDSIMGVDYSKRVGALEVQVAVCTMHGKRLEVVHSKLMSGFWPQPARVRALAESMLEEGDIELLPTAVRIDEMDEKEGGLQYLMDRREEGHAHELAVEQQKKDAMKAMVERNLGVKCVDARVDPPTSYPSSSSSGRPQRPYVPSRSYSITLATPEANCQQGQAQEHAQEQEHAKTKMVPVAKMLSVGSILSGAMHDLESDVDASDTGGDGGSGSDDGEWDGVDINIRASSRAPSSKAAAAVPVPVRAPEKEAPATDASAPADKPEPVSVSAPVPESAKQAEIVAARPEADPRATAKAAASVEAEALSAGAEKVHEAARTIATAAAAVTTPVVEPTRAPAPASASTDEREPTTSATIAGEGEEVPKDTILSLEGGMGYLLGLMDDGEDDLFGSISGSDDDDDDDDEAA